MSNPDCSEALANRITSFDAEIDGLNEELDGLVAATAPTLLGLFGVGTDVADQLPVTVGDNPQRPKAQLRSLTCA
ncbi:MAG: hypothetical protein WBK25_00010, partial [Candidatus Microthrix parvicella]